METVSRNTCYLKILDDGTNLINFKSKAQALCLARTVSISNSPCDSSFFLCKYFAGRLMSSLRPAWAHLRDISSPSAALPSLFYHSCLVTLPAVGNCDVTAKALYCKLLSIGSSPPILHRQWAQVIGPGFSLNCHWSLVREIFFTENFKNDLLWLIALRAVKVRDSLQNWGVSGSGTCASCPLRKTTDHCFLNCIRVKRVWARFAPSLTLVLVKQFVPNSLPVFFFLWPSAPTKRARIARHFVKSILYGIWVFPNKATFSMLVVTTGLLLNLSSVILGRRFELTF